MNNLILIGMPAVGKSTVGVLLAKGLCRDFHDTDVWIQAREGRSLQAIIDDDGLEAFRAVEERRVLEFCGLRTVIATGGSVVYSEKAMAHLAAQGRIIHLDLPFAELAPRLERLREGRGMVIPPHMTLQDLYDERLPLYRRYADATVECSGKDLEEVAEELMRTAAG